jgi:hypothetical protein
MTKDDLVAIFADDYKPPWLVAEERAITKSLNGAVTIEVEYSYRKNAYETLRRIARKHRKKTDG